MKPIIMIFFCHILCSFKYKLWILTKQTNAELEKECFEYPWSHEMVEETAGLSNFCGVVALNESGEVFGYAGAICAFDSADIALVAVEKEYRRQGAGYSMLKVLLKICQSDN